MDSPEEKTEGCLIDFRQLTFCTFYRSLFYTTGPYKRWVWSVNLESELIFSSILHGWKARVFIGLLSEISQARMLNRLLAFII